MAQKEIEQWAKILQESEAEDKIYSRACERAIEEAREATSYQNEELNAEDEIIDPKSLGFVNSDEDGEPYLVGGEEAEDSIDLAECGFTEDGEEAAVKEAEEYLKEDFHKDDEFASIELDVFDAEDGTGQAFADELKQEVPDVYARPSQKVGPNPIWKLIGTIKDLKNAYAFWLGLFSWKDVEDQGEAEGFWNSIVYEDGDTIQEADYREALAHAFDPVGLNASTANLRGTNVCELTVLKEAVQAEIQKRKMKKALLEADFNSLSDEDLAKLDSVLAAKEEVDNDTADDEDERVWLALLKTMGINSIEEYKAMDPDEFNRRFEASNQPLDSANGFSRSNIRGTAWHRPDKENGGATRTEFGFNPDYRRKTHAEEERERKRAEKAARDSQPIAFPPRHIRLPNGEKGTWSLADFGRLVGSLGPKRSKELMNIMLEIAHEDNKDDPEAEAMEIMFIRKLFGKKPGFRDIARAWYPGEDPNTRQQSINKFYQDTETNFIKATREASGTGDGSRETFEKKILGNEANFQKFLQIMRELSKKRASNKRSIINRGKTSAVDSADSQEDAVSSDETAAQIDAATED